MNWGSAWLVSQFFLTLTDAIGTAGTFWLFAGFSVVAFVWIWRKVPETKGRTLEEIEASFACHRRGPLTLSAPTAADGGGPDHRVGEHRHHRRGDERGGGRRVQALGVDPDAAITTTSGSWVAR